MFNNIIMRVPAKYKKEYENHIKESNIKNIIILGLVILVVQLVTYVYGLAYPFTNDVEVMNVYYFYYIASLFFDVFFMVVLILLVKNLGMKSNLTAYMMVFYLMLIHKWAMSTAIFDQFQGEGITVYFFSMFFIVILVDLSLVQMSLLFGSGYILFIQLLYFYSGQIGDSSEVIQAAGQFILFSIIIGYYIHLLRRKNFLQNESLKEMNKELEYLSYYDSLSGLYNRRKWELEYYLMHKDAVEEKKRIGMIIIDIDCFKQFNDTYGHVQGDKIIKTVSSVLTTVMDDQNANIGRYGGDEFVISIYDKDNQSIEKLISIINESIERKKILNKNALNSKYLTLSIGWKNIIPDEGDSEWDLVSFADRDLYIQKKYRTLKHVN